MMPTLNLSGRVWFPPDDPLDGPGCHVVTESRKGVSRGWVSLLPDGGGRRPLTPSRVVYHPSRGMTLHTFVDLEPGTYEAHSALSERQAHRAFFAVERAVEPGFPLGFRLIAPAPGSPAQRTLWDPHRPEAMTPPVETQESGHGA